MWHCLWLSSAFVSLVISVYPITSTTLSCLEAICFLRVSGVMSQEAKRVLTPHVTLWVSGTEEAYPSFATVFSWEICLTELVLLVFFQWDNQKQTNIVVDCLHMKCICSFAKRIFVLTHYIRYYCPMTELNETDFCAIFCRKTRGKRLFTTQFWNENVIRDFQALKCFIQSIQLLWPWSLVQCLQLLVAWDLMWSNP